MMHKTPLVQWILVIFKLIHTVSGGATCTAPAVRRGEPASITCHFEFDVSEDKTAVIITKLQDPDNPLEILNCPWMGSDHLLCRIRMGYEFDGTATYTMDLKIPSANISYVGQYLCQAIPSTYPAEPCNFTLTDRTVSQDRTVSCDIASAVRIGSPANITCHFSRDITTRKLVGIDRHTEGHPQVVLRCNWPYENRSAPSCTVKKGYSYEIIGARKLALRISLVTEDDVGQYVCREKEKVSTPCSLAFEDSLSDVPVKCDAPEVRKGSPANITCHFSRDIDETRKAFGIDRYTSGTPEALLRCYWPDANRLNPNCTHKEGYSYDILDTRTSILRISSTKAADVGQYVCHRLISRADLDPCSLRLKTTSNGMRSATPARVLVAFFNFLILYSFEHNSL